MSQKLKTAVELLFLVIVECVFLSVFIRHVDALNQVGDHIFDWLLIILSAMAAWSTLSRIEKHWRDL